MTKIRPEEERKYPAHSMKRVIPKKHGNRAINAKPELKEDGTVVADGVKIGVVKEPGKIEIYDRDKRRSQHKNRTHVIVDIEDLKELCEGCEKEFDTGSELEYT